MVLVSSKKEISKVEYEKLADNLLRIESEMFEVRMKYEELRKEQEKLNSDIEYYKLYHDPDVIISMVNNKNLGHKWVGRVRIPSQLILDPKLSEKRNYLTFNICEGSKYKDKEDESLLKQAKEMAIEKIKSKTMTLLQYRRRYSTHQNLDELSND